MKYIIRHAQLEVKKYNVLVRRFQACWLKFNILLPFVCVLQSWLELSTFHWNQELWGKHSVLKIFYLYHQSTLSFCIIIMKGLSIILERMLSQILHFLLASNQNHRGANHHFFRASSAVSTSIVLILASSKRHWSHFSDVKQRHAVHLKVLH